MVAFPETESMTIKRIEVALRNKDTYLLQEATNKLHEKYHTGFEFTMFDELTQIKTYIEQNDIPSAIKDVLCPTIDSILSSAGKEVAEYQIDEEEERKREALKRNYDYNFGGSVSNVPVSETQDEINQDTKAQNENEVGEEEQPSVEQKNLPNEKYEAEQQSFNFSEIETPKNEYQETAEDILQNSEQEYQEQEQESVQEYQEVPEQSYQAGESETKDIEQSENPVQESELPKDKVAIFYHIPSTKDETYGIRDYRQKLNFIKSNLYAKQPVNILGKISSLMDMVDVKDSICDFLLGISRTKCKKTFVTTSINQNITNYLANNGIKFQIPMVQNTYSENSSLDIIPMFGATNLFVCPKCGSMFLNTGSYLKVLSLGCPECDDIAYPSVYDSNDVECNSIFWHRAYSAMADSKIWIIINPPRMDENEAIMDFLRVAFKSSNPKKVYIYSKDNTLENIINQYNKNAQIISSFDSLEALYNDLINNKGIE